MERQIKSAEVQFLLRSFKLLADDTRFQIMGLLARRKYSVGELAAELDLTEPTISHHLAKLREEGLVNLKADGNSRFYWLNTDMLGRVKHYVNQMETLNYWQIPEDSQDDGSWIDTLDIEDWEKKVLKSHTYNGQITRIPAKEKKQLVLLRWLAGKFETGQDYREQEVTDILTQYHDDYAFWRRNLIIHRFLERKPDGSVYWKIEKE